MISNTIIDLAAGLSRVYTSADVAVVARPNTVLANMVIAMNKEKNKAGITAARIDNSEEEIYRQAGTDITNAATQSLNDFNAGNVNDFCVAFDVHIEEAKKRLQNIIYVLRNHVNPIVKELYDGVCEFMDSGESLRANQMEVRILYMPEVFKSMSFIQSVSPFGDYEPVEAISAGAYVPPINEEDLLERVKSGISDVDTSISTWLMANPESLSKVFSRVFLAIEHQDATNYDIANGTSALLTCPTHGLMYASLSFLLANSFYKDVPDGVVSEHGQYKEKLLLIRKYSGSLLARASTLFSLKSDTDIVVEKYLNNLVTVFPETYNRFIEGGGTNEVLLGAMMSTNRPFGLNALLEGKEQFLRVYYQQLALLEARDRADSQTRRREVTAHLFSKQLVALAASDDSVDARRINELKEAFAKTYNSLTNEDLEDFLVASIKLVCRTRFSGQPFEELLLTSHHLAIRHPNLDTDNVMTLAFTDYVGKWIASMLKVTDKAM